MGNKNGKIVLTEEIVEELSRSSGVEKKLIKQQCETFLVEHPSGNINKSDFKKFVKMALPDLNMKKMEANIFRMYDTNQDGNVSMEEFLIVFHVFSSGSAEENLQRIFRIFDVDNNGVISKNELKKLVKDMSSILKENNPEKCGDDVIIDSTFLEMNKDKDRSITSKEFCEDSLCGDDVITDSTFLEMDKDKDRSVTSKEFCEDSSCGDDLITDSTFLEMDKDKDGSITSEEFCAAVLAQDKFSKFLAVQVIDMFT